MNAATYQAVALIRLFATDPFATTAPENVLLSAEMYDLKLTLATVNTFYPLVFKRTI